MGNIALNKTAAASSFVMPYSASRAVDGSIAPIRRWLCNTVPCWLQVDLNTLKWINRYVVRNMPTAGWKNPDYNICNFKFQGSNDGYNWFDLDIVTNNNLAVVDHNITAVEVRYARLYVTGGLLVNPRIAFIMELEVYEAPPTSPYLSNIALSSGTLTPTFSKTTLSYTSSVAYDVSGITVTPTAEDPGATIEVNGVEVPSGQASEPINLNVGSNAITVKVTSKIGKLVQNYTITVTREESYFLTKTDVTYWGFGLPETTETITMDKVNLNYSINISKKAAKAKVTPFAEDTSVQITVNGETVPSGSTSSDITLSGSTTDVNIIVGTGSAARNYKVTIVEV